MPIILNACNWPQLGPEYLSGLKDAVAFVLSEFPSTVGIIATGTIVRGNPGPSSDLDVCVIHTEKFRQRVQRYSKGVPTEVFVNPPSEIERRFKGKESRPMTAHMLATGVVIAAVDPVVDLLRSKALELLRRRPVLPHDLIARRYAVATVLEDALDVWQRDRPTARMILSQAMEQMLKHAFLKASRFQPRMKDLLKESMALDPSLGRLALRFYRSRSFRTQLRMATLVADKILGARGFFEWQSEKEPVE